MQSLETAAARVTKQDKTRGFRRRRRRRRGVPNLDTHINFLIGDDDGEEATI